MWKFKDSNKNSLVLTPSESAGKQELVLGRSGRERKGRPACKPIILSVYTKGKPSQFQLVLAPSGRE